MLHGEPAVVPDIEHDDRIPQPAYRPTFVRSLLMVPVGSPAYWACPHLATPEEISSLTEVAAHAAEALERAGLEEAPWAPNFGLR